MATIAHSDIRAHAADLLLPPDGEFSVLYRSVADAGVTEASRLKVAFVAICRNAMPFLPFTLRAIEETGKAFADWTCFVYENDSTDGTKEFLSSWADGRRKHVEIHDFGRPHLNYTTETCRTVPLAEYRNRCRKWVDSRAADLVIVFDTDPWGGFSTDGVMNTVGWLSRKSHASAAGMAAYSWCEWGPPVWASPTVCHYDAFACRWNWWSQRKDMVWFHLWHPPVGSPPVRLNSAFGQMAVYRRESYLRGVYDGSDCEHVTFHRSMGGDFFLNPSMRCVSFWNLSDAPEDDSLHDDVH